MATAEERLSKKDAGRLVKQPGRRLKLLQRAAFALASAACLVAAVYYAGLEASFSALGNVDLGWLLVAFASLV